MKLFCTLLAIPVIAALTAGISAQTIKPGKTIFTSIYTSLGRGCKVLKGGNGTDDGSLCRGPGKYQVRVYGSAAALMINAEIRGTSEGFPLAVLSIWFDESKTKVEWRMANGKPFAAIMRVPKYGKSTDSDPYFGKVEGEQLIIRGLKGFTELESSVDAKTPGANAAARQIADKAYADTGVK